jgi:hypothetical protein
MLTLAATNLILAFKGINGILLSITYRLAQSSVDLRGYIKGNMASRRICIN